MIKRDIRVMFKKGGCPASTSSRALVRALGPVKLSPCVGASSAVRSVRAPGRSPS